MDVAPTLLALAGLEIPGDARGLALGELLEEGDRAFPDRVVYADVGFEASAYQGDGFTRAILEGPARGTESFLRSR